MLVVISYDISDDRRRLRVAKLLEAFGSRVLESVFECDLTAAQYGQLERRLRKVLQTQHDRVRIYFLCADCRVQTRIFGEGRLETSAPFYIV